MVIHTDPDEATEEINALDETVLTYAQSVYTEENSFVIMGDFNTEFQPSVYVAFLFQTDIPAVPDNYVVENINAKDLAAFNELFRYSYVLPAWRGVT